MSSKAVLAVVLGLVGCGEVMPGVSGGRSTTITVANNFFRPTPDTVPAGEVTFIWSEPSNGHDVIWDGGPTTPTNSEILTAGSIVASLVPGTYRYHCSNHGSPTEGMHGTIVVQ